MWNWYSYFKALEIQIKKRKVRGPIEARIRLLKEFKYVSAGNCVK